MRVAYVCADTGVPIFGNKGCSIHVQEIVRAFAQRGAEVDIFAARVGGTAPPDLAHCRVREFVCGASTTVAEREIAQQKLAAQIAAQVTFDQYSLIYERYSLWSAATQESARRHRVKSVLEINAPLIEEQSRHRELVDIGSARRLAVAAFTHASAKVAVSSEVEHYARTILGRKSGSVEDDLITVSNGVDVMRFHPHTAPSNKSPNFTIGFVGTLKPWHGVESLLNAFDTVLVECPAAELRIIGDGPMLPELQRLVAARPAATSARIEFLGAVTPAQMPHHLTAFDVAVAPYLTQENFYFSPLKVYEYMAAGLPVVASATGQLRELIEHGENGLLYKPGNAVELASALTRLAISESYRTRLGIAARQTVCLKHSWTAALEKILHHAFNVDQPALAL